jgi:hypothetical protein
VPCDIQIERAHRVGKQGAIIVKFLSYKQKAMILKNSNKLKTSSYRDVYVREDFSKCVRIKRQCLKQRSSELCKGNEKPKLRFDKLITSQGVFTYDLDTDQVRRVGKQAWTGTSGDESQGYKDTEGEEAHGNLHAQTEGIREWGDPYGDWDDRDSVHFGLFSPNPQQNRHSMSEGRPIDSEGRPPQTDYLLKVSEYPELNCTRERGALEMSNRPILGARSWSQSEAEKPSSTAREKRRLSAIPVRASTRPGTRSPVNTRNRARAASLSQGQAGTKPNQNKQQTNTLHSWVTGGGAKGTDNREEEKGKRGERGERQGRERRVNDTNR